MFDSDQNKSPKRHSNATLTMRASSMTRPQSCLTRVRSQSAFRRSSKSFADGKKRERPLTSTLFKNKVTRSANFTKSPQRPQRNLFSAVPAHNLRLDHSTNKLDEIKSQTTQSNLSLTLLNNLGLKPSLVYSKYQTLQLLTGIAPLDYTAQKIDWYHSTLNKNLQFSSLFNWE